MCDIEALTMGPTGAHLGSCVTEETKWKKKLNISEAMERFLAVAIPIFVSYLCNMFRPILATCVVPIYIKMLKMVKIHCTTHPQVVSTQLWHTETVNGSTTGCLLLTLLDLHSVYIYICVCVYIYIYIYIYIYMWGRAVA